MGMILHDWNLPTKQMLIRKAYEALPPGGAFIAIDVTPSFPPAGIRVERLFCASARLKQWAA